MNRTEFMSQLEILLRNVSDGEREEALQYYNDYFDDAGAENEQAVIEALGNPARVAENIRRELLEGQKGKSSVPADRALTEYGQADAEEKAEAGGKNGDVPAVLVKSAKGRSAGGEGDEGYFNILETGQSSCGENVSSAENPGAEGSRSGGMSGGNGGPGSRSGGMSGGNGGAGGWSGGMSGGNGGAGGWSGSASGGSGGAAGGSGASGGSGRSGGMTAALIVLLVFTGPFILTLGLALACVAFGLLMAWLGLILGFGLTALFLILVLFVLLAVGGMCIPVDPLVGFGVMGGGLICGGIGLLFLMLTVTMAGAVPAIIRGIGSLFRIGRKKIKAVA